MTHLPLTEAYCFLSVLLTGAVSAVVYSVCGFFRGIYTGKIATLLFDLVFSAVTVVLLYFVMQKACGGDIRIYQLAGFIIGFYMIKKIISLIKEGFSSKTASSESDTVNTGTHA